MKTPAERIEMLEEKVARLEREHLAGISASYWAAETVLRSLQEQRRISYIERRIATEEIEKTLRESLATNPELLDQLSLYVFKKRWRGEDI